MNECCNNSQVNAVEHFREHRLPKGEFFVVRSHSGAPLDGDCVTGSFSSLHAIFPNKIALCEALHPTASDVIGKLIGISGDRIVRGFQPKPRQAGGTRAA